jgi:hypothetical protein
MLPLSQTLLRRSTSASMPLRCSQSNAEASCRRSFRPKPRGSRRARRSVSAACFSRGENLRSNSIALVILAPSYALSSSLQQHRQQSEVRSPTRRLAPNSPMRWTDQDRLVRPNVEPDVGLAPTRKAPRCNADLAPLAKLQIAILRREQDWQPMARNRKLPHNQRSAISRPRYLCGACNQRRKASLEIAYLA